MQQRGRKSAASLAVVSTLVQKRQEPPSHLTADQKDLWRRVVETKPAEWFGDDSAPLLVEYTRAVSMCDRLEREVAAAIESGDIEVTERMLKMRDREAGRAAKLAAALRLTQQSRYTPQAAATANKRTLHAAKPWQTNEQQAG